MVLFVKHYVVDENFDQTLNFNSFHYHMPFKAKSFEEILSKHFGSCPLR